MNLRVIQLVLIIFLIPGAVWANSDDPKIDEGGEKTQRILPAQPAVVVSMCVLSANVIVRGWEKDEVMVQSLEGALLQLRREAGADEAKPAAKIEVYVVDKEDARRGEFRCQASSDLELFVPHGATVQIQSRDGSINISDVATAYAGSQNGDVDLERITQVAEVGTIGGSISIRESSGRMDLNSVGGTVIANSLRPGDNADSFEATTVSGEIELEQVAHAALNVRTTTGNVMMSGPLATGGKYGISTMSGNVTIELPADASFQLNAKISSNGDIITDFPLTLLSQTVSVAKPAVKMAPKPPKHGATSETPKATPPPTPPIADAASPADPKAPAPPLVVVKVRPTSVDTLVKISPLVVTSHTLRRISAICGTGDATISIASFSGTLHLQKN